MVLLRESRVKFPPPLTSPARVLSQLCPTLCDPIDCRPPGSSVHRISRQEYWSGLPFPAPGDPPDPGIELTSHALAGGFFTTKLPWEPGTPYYFLIINLLSAATLGVTAKTISALYSQLVALPCLFFYIYLSIEPYIYTTSNESSLSLRKALFSIRCPWKVLTRCLLTKCLVYPFWIMTWSWSLSAIVGSGFNSSHPFIFLFTLL